MGLSEEHRRPSPGWTLAVTSVAFFMVALDALVVMTALPSIGADLGAGMPTLEWTVNAYGLATATGIITAAALGDRYGRRRVFTAGLALFTVASAACALAPGAGPLIAARTLQGIGAAVVIPLSLTILTGAFPARRRGAIVGIWGGIAGIAVAGGPLVGGAVTQGIDWHWIFWVNVPVGVVTAVLAATRLAESRGPVTRLDLPAVFLACGGVGGVVWALVRGDAAGWSGAETLITLGLGLAFIAGLVAWEYRAAEPMLPPRLFRNPGFAAAGVTAFLMTAALLAAVFLATQYFQGVLGYSPLGTGLRFLPWTATPLVVAPAAGMLSDRVGQRPVLAAGMFLQAVGLAWVAVAATPSAGYGRFVLPLLVAGIGVSMALPTTSAAALGAVAPADVGKASGASNTLQRFGGAFGIAATTAVFAANGRIGTPAGFSAGFRPAMVLAAGISLLGTVTALAIRARRTPVPAQVDTEVLATTAS